MERAEIYFSLVKVSIYRDDRIRIFLAAIFFFIRVGSFVGEVIGISVKGDNFS